MTNKQLQELPRVGRARLTKLGLLSVVVFLVAAAVYTSTLITRRQQALKEVSRYNVTWLVSQAPLEAARLQVAVAAAAVMNSGVDEEEVQLRLDIIANRVQLLESGDVAQFVSTDPELRRIMADFRDAVRAGQLLMDEPALAERSRRMLALFSPLGASLSRLAAKANNYGGDLVAEDQRQLSNLHWLFAAILGALTLCGFSLIIALIWHHRRVSTLTWHNRQLAQAHEEVRVLVDDLRRTSSWLTDANARAKEAMADVQSRNQILQERDHELHAQNARFDAALNNMSQGLCLFDIDDGLVVHNQRFTAMFGTPPLGTTAATLLADARFGSMFTSPGPAHCDDMANCAHELSDGRVIQVSRQAISGQGWVATYEDITERRRSQDQLSHMARHDALTGLANRVKFREHMEHVLLRTRRGACAAVLYVDLDGFKGVNDTLGHLVGDELLRAVAVRLQECTCEVDLVARLGGDEFAIVQADAQQPVNATTLCDRLVKALHQPFNVQGHHIVIGASIGIALSDATATPDGLLRNADIALYRAKVDGRGTWRFFEPEMDAEVQARRRLEADLRRALAERQFEVFYQPLINASVEELTGFEALLRWNHPERGMVSPAEFIPLAEEIGVIRGLGAWVLERACADAAAWPVHVKVAVNLSPVQFLKGNLVREVEQALAGSGLAANRLELEITESVLLQDNDATLGVLHRLRGLGVRISMDDFGTGYSSLSYLRRFPFDKIKIDQSFVRNFNGETGSIEIIRAVVGLGRALGMEVLAEGVETAEQFRMLQTEGCHELQGYLFSKPKPLCDVPGVIARYSPAKNGSERAGERSIATSHLSLVSS